MFSRVCVWFALYTVCDTSPTATATATATMMAALATCATNCRFECSCNFLWCCRWLRSPKASFIGIVTDIAVGSTCCCCCCWCSWRWCCIWQAFQFPPSALPFELIAPHSFRSWHSPLLIDFTGRKHLSIVHPIQWEWQVMQLKVQLLPLISCRLNLANFEVVDWFRDYLFGGN